MTNLFKPSNKQAMNQAIWQQQANEQAAQKSQTMSMVDQYTPYGNLVYEPIGDFGGTQRWRATTTLSPEQQAIEDQNFQTEQKLATLANQQAGFLQNYLNTPLDTSGAPALSQGITGHVMNGYNGIFSGDLGSDFNTQFNQNIGGGYDTNFNRNIGGSFNNQFSGNLGANYNEQFSKDIGGGYNTNFNREIGGNYTDQLGQDFQTSVDLKKSYNSDFSAERNEIEDALMQRMQPQQQQDANALRNQLVQSGLRPGTAAWNSEMDRLQRGVNDARLATIAQAGQEQTRLVNMARDAAGFYNDATLAQAGFGNDATAMQFQLQNQAALNAAQFGQNAQLAQNTAALNQAQFGSNQQQAQNAAAMGQWNTNFQAQNAGNQASLQQAQFGSAQQQAQNAAAMGQSQFGSQQQQLQNDAAYQQWAAQNAAQEATNQAGMAEANYWNQLGFQQAAFQNAARSQYMNELYAQRNQPINEISALMSGSQVQQPNFVNTPQANMQPAQYQANTTPNPLGSGIFQLGSSLIGGASYIAGRK